MQHPSIKVHKGMSMIKRPEIFEYRGEILSPTYPYNSEYGDFPLMIQSGAFFIQFKEWIKYLGNKNPTTYAFDQGFVVPGHSTYVKLDDLNWHRMFYQQLDAKGFTFERLQFKLEKWDPISKSWRMLTIDCQIVAAAYLCFLCKHINTPAPQEFIDTIHQEQLIKFKLDKVTIGRENHIEVTPYLETPGNSNGTPATQERLRISVKDATLFPGLKFTTLALMQPPPPEFKCAICFEGPELIDGVLTPVLQAGCGNEEGHCFHRHCIEQWLETKSSCPICRTSIRHLP
jgi:hypothetical protein